MRYSVWNPSSRLFDYFDDGAAHASTNAPAPKHIASRTLGSTIDQAMWPLPAGAVAVGSGPHAIGRVAVARGAALGAEGGGDLSLVKAGLLLAAGALGIKVLLPRRRR